MFVAAAIAAAFTARDPLAIFETALKFVPQKSRFHEIVADSLQEVRRAADWLDGYARVHNKYAEYSHCRVYQEVGTLINTVRFARDVGDGICMQVAQGNDTDCFGATVGSILGAYFGPGHLEPRWLEPFRDEIRCALAQFYERSLSKVAARMAGLPALAAQELAQGAPAAEGAGPLAPDDGLAPPER
jgi:ADP-ribosylglycohydrolase